ncbi:DUF4387 family protein [Nonomuraea insulae]|uniref:DUF4387 family protein n=1 Tax=Nonomuraea insulae TaxID=1616787 RepID=A0ABW1CYY0_9ACTN
MADTTAPRAAPPSTVGDLALEVRSKNAGTIQMFRIPSLNVVKTSFPRPVSQGSLWDRDMHAGQHHVPLAVLRVPVTTASVSRG